jgi:hypothetical protein
MTKIGAHRRRQRRRNETTYEERLSDRKVFERADYQCEMPVCLCPYGRKIYVGLTGEDPWRASIDHIIRITDGGTDAADNKRASHAKCNAAMGNLVDRYKVTETNKRR